MLLMYLYRIFIVYLMFKIEVICMCENRVPRLGIIDNGTKKYELMECIGQGGSSLIYEAKSVEEEACSQTYLIKELYPYIKWNSLVRDERTRKIYGVDEIGKDALSIYRERMRYEAQMAEFISVKIDNYVEPPIHNAGIFIDRQSENSYMVYRKKSGMVLQQFIQSKQFLELSCKDRLIKYILPLLFQLCESLGMLHQNGYCHGDISPDNLFIDNRGGGIKEINPSLFLIDFNSCFPLENQKEEWIYSYKEGFSADELRNYSGKKLDKSVDTYSVIAVFFYMLQGKAPKSCFLMKLWEMERELSQPVLNQIEKICKRGLKHNPKNRYPDCNSYGDLVEDLRELSNRLELRGGVTKAYLWEKICHLYFSGKELTCNPMLLPPTKECIDLSQLLDKDLQENIALIGEAGIGKSSFVKGYLKKHVKSYFSGLTCRIPFVISLNAYNQYSPECFDKKNRVKDRNRREEFFLLLDLIVQEYNLQEQDTKYDKNCKEGLLREFCRQEELKEYIIVLEDIHSIDPQIKQYVNLEIENAMADWKNVSFLLTGRTEKAILRGVNKAFHLERLRMEQVIYYIEKNGDSNQIVERSNWLSPELRDGHMRQFLQVPQFLVLYRACGQIRKQGIDGEPSQTAAEVFCNYFFGEVRAVLSRSRGWEEIYFSSDSSGIRMFSGVHYSYSLIAIFIQLVLPALAFEMEKKSQKVLTSDEFRDVVRRLIPLFPLYGNLKGIYQDKKWMYYLEMIQTEWKKEYRNLWDQLEIEWYRVYGVRPGKAACNDDIELAEEQEERYEEQLSDIFCDCLKLLTNQGNSYCFFNSSYQEFFCAWYYYQRLKYWECTGEMISKEDWKQEADENIYKYLGEILLSVCRKNQISDMECKFKEKNEVVFPYIYKNCQQPQVCSLLAKACYYNFKNYGSEWLKREREWSELQLQLGDKKAYYFLALLEKKAGDETKRSDLEERRKKEILEVQLMQQAANADVWQAFYYMGIYYQKGKVLPKNPELSRDYLYRAVKAGDLRAISYLAGVLERDWNDLLGAIYYYRKAAEAKTPQALTSLVRMSREGNIVLAPEEEENYLKEGALQLNVRCLCDLGDFYLRYPKHLNQEEAARLYNMAAQLKNNRGMCSYGICLENGIGIARDEKTAYQWYEKAANAGRGINAKAQLCRAVCSIWGKGTEKNKERAKEVLQDGIVSLKFASKDTREAVLKKVMQGFYKQIECDCVLIRQNYIEIEDYMPFLDEEEN